MPAGLAEKVGKPYVGPHIFSGIQRQHRLGERGDFRSGAGGDAGRAASRRRSTWPIRPSYKLTGGVFSRKPGHLEAARREFRVGNLYLNRGITGALVGRQPFGGFGLSGIGSKAGGADYLLHFVEPRCSPKTPCVTASRRDWNRSHVWVALRWGGSCTATPLVGARTPIHRTPRYVGAAVALPPRCFSARRAL